MIFVTCIHKIIWKWTNSDKWTGAIFPWMTLESTKIEASEHLHDSQLQDATLIQEVQSCMHQAPLAQQGRSPLRTMDSAESLDISSITASNAINTPFLSPYIGVFTLHLHWHLYHKYKYISSVYKYNICIYTYIYVCNPWWWTLEKQTLFSNWIC